MDAIVSQIAVLQELSMATRAVWKIPLMYYLAVDIDEVDRSGTREVCEERVAG